jgi:anoctamin-8
MGYTNLTRWFVGKENHEFTDEHENSVINKSFMFKFINSFMAIAFMAFIRQDSYEALFQAIGKVFVTKQASYLIVEVLIPWVRYKWRQRAYFQDLDRLTELQERDKGMEAIEVEKELTSTGKYIRDASYKRQVLDCNRGITKEQWNLDDIELNGQRFPFIDAVDYYSEMIIQFGFITMFAAAFPLGPALALLSNLAEIRMRVFKHLHIDERPLAEKAGGIGAWLGVWEKLSLLAVFTNFMLLYLKPEAMAIITSFFENVDPASILWIYIASEHCVILFKFIFAFFIPDMPKWVRAIEERNAYLENKDKEYTDPVLSMW